MVKKDVLLKKTNIKKEKKMSSISHVTVQTLSIFFKARINMVMLQSEDVMKAAMAAMMKSKDMPEFSKL